MRRLVSGSTRAEAEGIDRGVRAGSTRLLSWLRLYKIQSFNFGCLLKAGGSEAARHHLALPPCPTLPRLT